MQAGDSILRLYALVRRDLGMTPGKMAAQAGHAFVETLRRCIQTDPARERDYHAHGLGTKICLAVPSLELLLQAHEHT